MKRLLYVSLYAYCLASGCEFFAPDSCDTGATAMCIDGTYSYSANRSGTCSSHGGASMWCDEAAGPAHGRGPVDPTYCRDGICGIDPGSGAYCGDGILQSGEECDDGNNVEGDGCYGCLLWNEPCLNINGGPWLLEEGGACGDVHGNRWLDGVGNDTLWYCDGGEMHAIDCAEYIGNTNSCGWDASLGMFDCLRS